MKARSFILLALGLLLNISLQAQDGVFENVSYTDKGELSVVESFMREGDCLQPLKRISYEYDSNGLCLVKSLDKWNASSNAWEKVAKTAYDNSNSSVTNFIWDKKQNNWIRLI